jgi:hypothetical protein
MRRDCPPSALRQRTELLLALYAVSVFSGGLAHQWCTTPLVVPSSFGAAADDQLLAAATAAALHAPLFQAVWRLCVGSVCAAGWAQGSIACALARRYASAPLSPDRAADRAAAASSPREGELVASAARRGVRVAGVHAGAVVGGLLGGLAGGLVGALGGPWLLGGAVARAGVGAASVLPGAGAQLVSLFGGLFGGLAVGVVLGALACSGLVHRRGRALAQGAFRLAAHRHAEALWFAWAAGWCGLTHWGALSMLRPAMDIFLAGTTQAFPTVHIAAVLAANGACDAAPKGGSGAPRLSRRARLLVLVGIFFNMPLLGLYPVVLSQAPWLGEGTLNCGLHCWLTVAWGLQWWSLKQVCTAYGPDRPPPAKAL